jgi:outer membrane murein-binding lipoprotein Lpp
LATPERQKRSECLTTFPTASLPFDVDSALNLAWCHRWGCLEIDFTAYCVVVYTRLECSERFLALVTFDPLEGNQMVDPISGTNTEKIDQLISAVGKVEALVGNVDTKVETLKAGFGVMKVFAWVATAIALPVAAYLCLQVSKLNGTLERVSTDLAATKDRLKSVETRTASMSERLFKLDTTLKSIDATLKRIEVQRPKQAQKPKHAGTVKPSGLFRP